MKRIVYTFIIVSLTGAYAYGVGAITTQEQKALLKAVREHVYRRVETLLQNGADPNVKEDDGRTVLIEAIQNGDHGIVQLLLKRGANVNEGYQGYTPLMTAIVIDMPEQSKGIDTPEQSKRIIVNYLLETPGLNVNLKDGGATALIYAIRSKNPHLVEQLLDAGADVNIPDEHNMTPLMETTFLKNEGLPILKLLLKHQVKNPGELSVSGLVDMTMKNENGETALMLAVDNGRDDMVEELLEKEEANEEEAKREKKGLRTWLSRKKKRTIDAQDNAGETALIKAVKKQDSRLIVPLLNNGANTKIKDKSGFSVEKDAWFSATFERVRTK